MPYHSLLILLLTSLLTVGLCPPTRGQALTPNQADTSIYGPLDQALDSARIIYLGEQSHRDGATFTAKVDLINYLHERHGFTVLAFEGDAFALDAWNSALRAGQAEKSRFHATLMPFWSRATAVDSLADYLLARRGELQVTGFDNQLSTQFTQDSLVATLRRLLPAATPVDFVVLDELVSRLLRMDSFTERDVADAEGIQTAVARALPQTTLTPDRRIFWTMLLESLLQEVTASSEEGAGRPEPVQNARDRQMARNLRYLTQQYPGQKIICWGASYHFAKDLSTLQLGDSTTGQYLKDMNTLMGHDSLPLAELLELREAVPMAQVFAELSSLPTLSVAFTAGGGYTDQGHLEEDTLRLSVPSAPLGSWEEQFIAAGDTESIYIFSVADTAARHLAALGYLPLRGDWSTAYDAIYYTPRMYPVTYLPDTSQELFDTTAAPPAEELQGRVVDAETGEPIAYAYVYASRTGTPLLTNLSGYFRGPVSVDSLRITAIGYATASTRRGASVYTLQPMAYVTEEVLVRTGKIDPLQIVRAAAAAVPFNYPQEPSQARFLWREVYTDSTKADTLDAILRIHDQVGYDAQNWERVVNSRTARIDSLHHRSDWKKARTGWDSYSVLDVFGHDPLLSNDRPLNPARFNYYTYELLGTQNFAGKKVFVVAFTNQKPNSFTAGTTHLATHTGKLYINSDDFAVVQYEEALAQRPFVRKGRTLIMTIRRSYQYGLRRGKYVLSLVQVANHQEVTTETSDYHTDQRKEVYLLDWNESPTQPLEYPLMKLHRQPLRGEVRWDSERLFTTLK